MRAVGLDKGQARLQRPRRVVLPHALFKPGTQQSSNKGKQQKNQQVSYGKDWYAQTRQASRQFRTTREEIEYRRQANLEANNGRERKDLYTDNWDGDVYKGSSFNILTVLAAITVLAPLLGLGFALQTYGVLWG
jgi:hypothetical protein